MRTIKNTLCARQIYLWAISSVVAWVPAGCRTPDKEHTRANKAAYAIIREQGAGIIPGANDFNIDPPETTIRRRLLIDQKLPLSNEASLGSRKVARIPQWPNVPSVTNTGERTQVSLSEGLKLSLVDALQIAARESRTYQSEKERVFKSALALDLEKDAFRNSWQGVLDTLLATQTDGDGERVTGTEGSASIGLEQKLKTGGQFALNLGVDLARLITQGGASSLGLLADASISIPLLRGSNRFVVTEPLKQAERNVVYALYNFARFRRDFAVDIASDYFGVLDRLSQVQNAADSYKRLQLATRRAERQAEAGRLPEIQVDQVRQDELSAQTRWISAISAYDQRLDLFKAMLGLPPDAQIQLSTNDLVQLKTRAAPLLKKRDEALTGAGGPRQATGLFDLTARQVVERALDNRLDLRIRIGRVFDAQRNVAIKADPLRADLTLLGKANIGESRSIGSADRDDAEFHPADGHYSLGFGFDLPLERTAERNDYRNSLIAFEEAVRDVQELEDQIKNSVREDLRNLKLSRATVTIQARAVEVARRRLESTSMFLEAGRAETRDVLEAEQSLVSAQNALTRAIVDYRISELQLQSDMDLLAIDTNGLWREYAPAQPETKDDSHDTDE